MLGHIIDAIVHVFSSEAAVHAARNPSAAQALRKARLVVWIGVLVGLAGIGIAVAAYCEGLAGEASAGWPRAPGFVESASVVEIPTRVTSYHAEIRYRFTVQGRSYTGDRLSYNFKPSDKDGCARVVGRYPPGCQVQVSYDPADPSSNVLEPGTADGTHLKMALLCMVIPGLGLATIALGGSMRRKALKELRPGDPRFVRTPDNPYRPDR